MGRYPFGEYATAYMESVRGIYAETTWVTRNRRYKRMERTAIELKEQKRIKTLSPKSMSEEDVKEYILYRKESGVSTEDLGHEVDALRKLLLFAGNNAVDVCLNHNPGLKPVCRNRRRIPAMSDEVYDMIADRSRNIDPYDFRRLRAYTLVMLCLNTGTRNKEIRFAEVKDLDTTNWILDIVHVKGEDSYGMRRQVPIAPEIHQLILEYLLARQKWMADFSVNSPALFPSRESDDGFLAGNTIRQIKKVVEDDIGVSFELRQCRRTFGQRNLDKGLDIESASVLMGHATTNTTERFYSRMKLEKAQNNLKKVWMANTRDGEQQETD